MQIEVVEAEVTLTNPSQVITGASFDIGWSNTTNSADFITIVPMGADMGKVGSHVRSRDDSEGQLTAPATPGLYEVRYVLEEGRTVQASVQIEVVEAEIGILGLGMVRSGADVDVTWSSTINAADFVTIVPMGADVGSIDIHIRTRDEAHGRMNAPDEPGMYELRYVLEEGRGTLATAPHLHARTSRTSAGFWFNLSVASRQCRSQCLKTPVFNEGNFAPDALLLCIDMSVLDRSDSFQSLKSCYCGSQGPEALSVPEQSL